MLDCFNYIIDPHERYYCTKKELCQVLLINYFFLIETVKPVAVCVSVYELLPSLIVETNGSLDLIVGFQL